MVRIVIIGVFLDLRLWKRRHCYGLYTEEMICYKNPGLDGFRKETKI